VLGTWITLLLLPACPTADHRLCGAERVEVTTLAEMEASLARGHTAFVLLLADRYDPSPTWLTLEQVAPLAAAAAVPIVVDAAADYPTVPNPYLTQVRTDGGLCCFWVAVCPVPPGALSPSPSPFSMHPHRLV
jgi:hypothetical protein